jgi:hypothetical protein
VEDGARVLVGLGRLVARLPHNQCRPPVASEEDSLIGFGLNNNWSLTEVTSSRLSTLRTHILRCKYSGGKNVTFRGSDSEVIVNGLADHKLDDRSMIGPAQSRARARKARRTSGETFPTNAVRLETERKIQQGKVQI